MNTKAETVLKEALGLTEPERTAIAGALLESLDPLPDPEIDLAWRGEVARRVAEIEAGVIEPIPWEEVRNKLWARLGEVRHG